MSHVPDGKSWEISRTDLTTDSISSCPVKNTRMSSLKRTIQYINQTKTKKSGCSCCSITNEKECQYYYNYNRFTTLCPGLARWVGTRRINHSEFCWSRHDGVAVASAEPYASYLHFAPEDNHASTSSVRFLRAGCPSWHPTNSIKALKAN